MTSIETNLGGQLRHRIYANSSGDELKSEQKDATSSQANQVKTTEKTGRLNLVQATLLQITDALNSQQVTSLELVMDYYSDVHFQIQG